MSEQHPTGSPAEKPSFPPKHSAEEALPEVEAPSGSFLMQLFVIPLILVAVVATVFFMFNWLAHMDADPVDLARDFNRLHDGSWQKAHTLAELLGSRRYDHLRDDKAMAAGLAEVLAQQVEQGSNDDKAVQLRVFLCSAVGQFRVTEVLPALLAAATSSKGDEHYLVRRAAVESLAVHASQLPPEMLPPHRSEIVAALLAASREKPESDPKNHAAELRSSTAFALGVLGGPAALDALADLTGDPYPNARFNAANGLARHGDERAFPLLAHMLDPAKEDVVASETAPALQRQKRVVVMANAVRAAGQLLDANPTARSPELEGALERLIEADFIEVRGEAKDLLTRLRERNQVSRAAGVRGSAERYWRPNKVRRSSSSKVALLASARWKSALPSV